jgi:hypothetical protein
MFAVERLTRDAEFDVGMAATAERRFGECGQRRIARAHRLLSLILASQKLFNFEEDGT